MINLAQGGVSHEEAVRLLSFPGGTRDVVFSLFALRGGIRRLCLSLLEYELNFSYESPVKYSGRFVVAANDAFEPSSDLIELELSLTLGGKTLCYPFVRLKPTRAIYGDTITIFASDETVILQRSDFGRRPFFEAGSRYTALVEHMLADCGLKNIAIDPSAKALPAPREDWPEECSVLSVANALLSEIGYRSLECSPGGVISSGAYLPPADSPCKIHYTAGHASVILREKTLERGFLSPNRFVGIVSDPKATPMCCEYVIDDPANPVSPAQNGGYTITLSRQFERVCDPESLRVNVKKWALDSSQSRETLTLRTAVMPHHSARDIVWVDCGGISGAFVETDWVIKNEQMTHTLRRLYVI